MRPFRLTFVLCSTLALVSIPQIGAAPADSSLQAVFGRMDQASVKFKGLKADMKKLSHTDIINEDSVDTGTITVKAPKPHDLRMLIEFQKPDQKTVLVAGTKVDIYYPKTNTVQEFDLGKNHRSQMEQFLRLGFGSNSKDLQDAYTVTLGGPETIAGEPTTRIELVPKSKDLYAQFPKFELWISDQTGISIQQKMYQPGKDYSIATYTNMQVNPNIPDSAVNLNLPKGVVREYPQK
ncbi:MAG TPA: outer membrane lipoprotein-sorting protein [Bryobacteraceae bacterium]|jgi:outer membrane lipoprotein-sorting protein